MLPGQASHQAAMLEIGKHPEAWERVSWMNSCSEPSTKVRDYDVLQQSVTVKAWWDPLC